MGSKKHRNKDFVLPRVFCYDDFVVGWVEPRMVEIIQMRWQVDNNVNPYDQNGVPRLRPNILGEIEDQLDTVAERLQKVRCEKPAQMKHVAERLQRMGYKSKAVAYLVYNLRQLNKKKIVSTLTGQNVCYLFTRVAVIYADATQSWDNQMTGQKSINLIEAAVMDMGYELVESRPSCRCMVVWNGMSTWGNT